MIADHVLRMHRYLPPGVEEGTPIFDNSVQSLNVADPAQGDADHEPQEVSPFEKFDPLLHIGITKSLSSTRRGKEKKMEVLSMAFIKKYVQYAKDKSPPVLTKGAADLIVNFYANLRNEDNERNVKKVYCQLPCRTGFVLITGVLDVTVDRSYTRDPHPSLDGPCKSASLLQGSRERCESS
jgi:DNA replication licensing factor MCM3